MEQAKILVADDESDFLGLLSDWLLEEGYDVYSATDGGAALRLYFQHRPDLSVTDLRMPGLNGFELIGRIREMSDSHVLVLSALGDEDHVVRGLELGADDYMVKPVTKRAFLMRVRSMLRRALPTQEISGDEIESCQKRGDGTGQLQVLSSVEEIAGSEMAFTPALEGSSEVESCRLYAAGQDTNGSDAFSHPAGHDESELYEGTVKLAVDGARDMATVMRFVEQLHRQPQFRLLRLTGKQRSPGVDILLGLREPVSLKLMIHQMDGVSLVTGTPRLDSTECERPLEVRLA